jgi:glycosyltransferase involved in cell wall biosynthesis
VKSKDEAITGSLICLDEKYCTTRLVTQEKSIIENKLDESSPTELLLPENGDRKEGGLRARGYYKKSLDNKPLITVITVIFNGEQFLEKTILSVIRQSYENVEYIIIDGGSTDNTLDIIRKYEHAIDYWVSKKDTGIYDAMNKGIDLATGSWINFMNGGDCFYTNSIVESIFNDQNYQNYQNYQVVFGNQEVCYPSGRKRHVKAGLVKNLWKRSQFCHQAAFVDTKYHKKHKFNLRTKIVADFEFFYLAWKNQLKFKFVNKTICSFDAGGVSDGDSMQVFWEIAQVKVQYGIRGWFLAYSEALYSKLKWTISKIIWH